MSVDELPPNAVEFESLKVQVGSRELLADTSAQFESGKITLIVGPSGAGKSVLLRILSGAVDSADSPIQFSGKVQFGEQQIVAGGPRPSVGVVFQYFALFDEFSARDNVRFAQDHVTGSSKQDGIALLQELDVPQKTPIAMMSGGQQQRLAIARTLAFDPDVILYDEPTSGLDSTSANRVAELIARTQEAHQKTSIIVTHDYESLPKIADAIYLLDANQRKLRPVPKSEWPKLDEYLQAAAAPIEEAESSTSTSEKLTRCLGDFFVSTTNALTAMIKLPMNLLPLWKSPRWGIRYLWHYLMLVAGPSAWFYIAIAGIIIGFVTTHFTFRFLPYAQYTEPLIIEDLLRSIGFALYRILVPVLTTILIAARCGAAVASDIGGKTYGRQMDSLATYGVKPCRYLLTGNLWAFLLGTPALVGFGFFLAKYTSLIVFTVTHPKRGPDFWDAHFHDRIRLQDTLLYDGTGWLVLKLLCCAAGIGLISYFQASRPKTSINDVSHSITAAILWSTLFVLVVHFVFTFLEFVASR
ncbi:MAG: sulfate ABC transporter ATP-binding protein [Planctomycetaceae bacterium]|nr:sulfate ABC transporter ATP-binding protein [Planctomycetaceae bacterium]